MQPLWLITQKNLRLLLRTRSSALVVVLAPLLIILILGLSFNTSNTSNINVGVYAPSFTSDTESFMSTLQEDGFKVIKYSNFSQECIEHIKLGYIHTCIFLPPLFSIESNTPKEITFHIDPSRINLVWMIQETLKERLNMKSQEVSQDLAQNVLTLLADTNTRLGEEKDKLNVIKERGDTATGGTDQVKQTLTNLDFITPQKEYNLNVASEFRTALSPHLTGSVSKIDDAKSTIDAINSSLLNETIKTEINALLDNAKQKLGNATSLLADTSAPFMAVSSLISELQTDLEASKNKLSIFSSTVSSSVSNLDGVNSAITEGVRSMQNVQTALEGIKTNLGGLQITEAGVISKPLITKIQRVNAQRTNLNYMFPTLLVIVIMFSSLVLGTSLVMMEKNSPAFMRNFFLPVKKVTFVLSTYLTTVILIVVQLIVILGVSLFFIDESFSPIPGVALILFLAASVFTFLGMAIGYIFASEETAVLASISLGSLLLFVSGILVPLESMSPSFLDLTLFNPFVLSEKLIRETFIFQSAFEAIWMDLLVLAGYAAALFLVILVIESFLHDKLRNRFMFRHHKKHRVSQKENKGSL